MAERRLNSLRLRPKKPLASMFGVTFMVIDREPAIQEGAASAK